MAITKSIGPTYNAPLGTQFESGVNASGGVVVLRIAGISSDITTAAQNLATVYNGDIEIEEMVFDTDVTGLAGGTTLEILTDDPVGLAVFASMAESSMGANTTHAFIASTPWTVYTRRVIRAGYHLQILGTTAAGTGSGAWRLNVTYRPLFAAATMS